jgi:hypothetical protein
MSAHHENPSHMEEDGQRITVEVIREAMASCALRTRAASDNDRRVAPTQSRSLVGEATRSCQKLPADARSWNRIMNPSMPGWQTTLPLRVRAATDDPRHRVGSVPHRLATDLRVMVVDIALPGMLPEPTRSTATADGLATAGREALGCIAAEERECHQFSLQVSVKVHSNLRKRFEL